MRENLIQAKSIGINGRILIEKDWYPSGLPANIKLAKTVYIDTSYGFASFNSKKKNGLVLDKASGCYGIVSLIVSEHGQVTVGKFSVLNSTNIICNNKISIGNHCMLAWGSFITDTWLHPSDYSVDARKKILHNASHKAHRTFPFQDKSSPVVINDNCWVGFDSVIMPGVILGRGCVVGCKTIVTENVPPYAVVSGNPTRIIKYLEEDDTENAKHRKIMDYIKR